MSLEIVLIILIIAAAIIYFIKEIDILPMIVRQLLIALVAVAAIFRLLPALGLN